MAMKGKRKPDGRLNGSTSGQSRRFVEAARELGVDQSEEEFDRALKKIVKAPVPPKEPKKPE